MKIQTMKIKNIPVTKLKHLAFPHGMMLNYVFPKRDELAGRAWLLYDDEGAIRAWAFVVQEDPYNHWTYRSTQFGVYVQKEYRRRGFAQALYKLAKEDYPDMSVSRHDWASERLYDKLGA